MANAKRVYYKLTLTDEENKALIAYIHKRFGRAMPIATFICRYVIPAYLGDKWPLPKEQRGAWKDDCPWPLVSLDDSE